jgi:hypothetical protein
MKTVALEDLVAGTILAFCENAAELGCPKKAKEVDMWYRYLQPNEQRKVADKLLEIIERDSKRFAQKEKGSKKMKKAKGRPNPTKKSLRQGK